MRNLHRHLLLVPILALLAGPGLAQPDGLVGTWRSVEIKSPDVSKVAPHLLHQSEVVCRFDASGRFAGYLQFSTEPTRLFEGSYEVEDKHTPARFRLELYEHDASKKKRVGSEHGIGIWKLGDDGSLILKLSNEQRSETDGQDHEEAAYPDTFEPEPGWIVYMCRPFVPDSTSLPAWGHFVARKVERLATLMSDVTWRDRVRLEALEVQDKRLIFHLEIEAEQEECLREYQRFRKLVEDDLVFTIGLQDPPGESAETLTVEPNGKRAILKFALEYRAGERQ